MIYRRRYQSRLRTLLAVSFLVLILNVLGCSSNSTSSNPAEIKTRSIEQTVPTADGNAYLVVLNKTQDNRKIINLYYVDNDNVLFVKELKDSPIITPLANGDAILIDNGLFRLSKALFFRLNLDEKKTSALKERRDVPKNGFWFVRWVTDKNGLTDADREEHFAELEAEEASQPEPDPRF
jgi:hypothetical protein